MADRILRVYLQVSGNKLHPVSRKILSTVRMLGKDYVTQGVAFVPSAGEVQVPERSGLDEIVMVEGAGVSQFYPEPQAKFLACMDRAEILLFPATPEGRAVSAMTAAMLHTGVTADCTALSFREDGLLLQTRPAFSGNRLASIVTTGGGTQTASLRFGSDAPEFPSKTRIIREQIGEIPGYSARWLEVSEPVGENRDVILAVGGGLQNREDLTLLQELALRLGAELCCSRALVDRGWMPRSRQIGLSGRSVSANLLICFGISGSVQFQAGLDRIGKLVAVDLSGDTRLMKLADVPIQGDLNAIARAMLRRLEGETAVPEQKKTQP